MRCSTILFDELPDHVFKIRIAAAKAPRKPVPATLGDSFAVRYHVELAGFARRTNGLNV